MARNNIAWLRRIGVIAGVSALALVACQSQQAAQVVPAPPAPAAVAAAPAPPAPTQTPTPVAAKPLTEAQIAGEALYQKNCAACHDKSEETRSPSKVQLRAMSLQFLNYTLTAGKMQTQGKTLTPEERGTLITYLSNAAAFGATPPVKPDWANAVLCPADQRKVDLSGQVVSVGFGYDRTNTRALTAKQAGLTTKQLSSMDLAWSVGFPDIAEMRSQGATVGTTLFIPVAATGPDVRDQPRDAEAVLQMGLHDARRRAAAHQRRLWQREPTARRCWSSPASTRPSTPSTR